VVAKPPVVTKPPVLPKGPVVPKTPVPDRRTYVAPPRPTTEFTIPEAPGPKNLFRAYYVRENISLRAEVASITRELSVERRALKAEIETLRKQQGIEVKTAFEQGKAIGFAEGTKTQIQASILPSVAELITLKRSVDQYKGDRQHNINGYERRQAKKAKKE
jgi:hypothetical protein